jgi:hypothetical protein
MFLGFDASNEIDDNEVLNKSSSARTDGEPFSWTGFLDTVKKTSETVMNGVSRYQSIILTLQRLQSNCRNQSRNGKVIDTFS